MIPGCRIAFAEVKAPGEVAREGQLDELQKLQACGCLARVVSSKAEVAVFLDTLQTDYKL